MKTMLITGGAGFIGSHYVSLAMQQHPEWRVVCLDALTYAADLEYLQPFLDDKRFRFVEGNVCDASLLQQLFAEEQVSGIIHFAAESHVDNSISGPEPFVITNILGTFRLLEAARCLWQTSPGTAKAEFAQARFLQVSTDEVYGSLGPSGFFTEESRYQPNSPYSASKASADFLVRSYVHTFGLNAVVTNCSNNFGPHQHREKLIPTIIRRALAEEAIPIYGDGQNVRDWLYVEDHCRAVDLVLQKGRAGETYLIGARNEQNNLQLARRICRLLDTKQPRPSGPYEDLITFVPDRPGHDQRYAIDPTKIASELDWKPSHSFEQALSKTVDWYRSRKI